MGYKYQTSLTQRLLYLGIAPTDLAPVTALQQFNICSVKSLSYRRMFLGYDSGQNVSISKKTNVEVQSGILHLKSVQQI